MFDFIVTICIAFTMVNTVISPEDNKWVERGAGVLFLIFVSTILYGYMNNTLNLAPLVPHTMSPPGFMCFVYVLGFGPSGSILLVAAVLRRLAGDSTSGSRD